MERYTKKDLLGYGTYSMVYRGQDLVTSEEVALKIIKLAMEEGMPSTALREVSILKQLSHKNVLRIINVIHTESQLSLVLEYVDSDLRRALNSREEIDERDIIAQLVEGVKYIHSQQVVHRDLKPQNLLLSRSGQLKIADFGLARSLAIKMPAYSSEVVTLWYRAPELLMGCRNYEYSVDMWSVGCIVSEILTQAPLFPGTDKQDQLNKVLTFTGMAHGDRRCRLKKMHPRGGEEMVTLMSRTLLYEPQERITAAAACSLLSNKE
jgi:serine/threonine protein kinase